MKMVISMGISSPESADKSENLKELAKTN